MLFHYFVAMPRRTPRGAGIQSRAASGLGAVVIGHAPLARIRGFVAALGGGGAASLRSAAGNLSFQRGKPVVPLRYLIAPGERVARRYGQNEVRIETRGFLSFHCAV